MLLEIWSDVACPFCFIGKRNLEAALESFEHTEQLTIRWRAFQLAPDLPAEVPGTQLEHLARKYRLSHDQAVAAQDRVIAMGAESGLELALDRVRIANTKDAHRLVQAAYDRADAQTAVQLVERLFRAYFQEGALLSDHATLTALATDAGLATETATEVLTTDAYADAVARDAATAHSAGLNAVPAFVLDRRRGLLGAQPPEVMLEGLHRAWADHVESAAEAEQRRARRLRRDDGPGIPGARIPADAS